MTHVSFTTTKIFQKETKTKIKTETSQVTSRINLWSLLHVQSQYVHAFSTLNWARTKLWRLVSNWILVSCQPHRVSLGSQFISCSLVCSCLGLIVVHECSAALSCIVKFRYHMWIACLCHGAWNTKLWHQYQIVPWKQFVENRKRECCIIKWQEGPP